MVTSTSKTSVVMNWINNTPTPSHDDQTFTLNDPYTSQPLSHISASSIPDIEAALSSSSAAFQSWRNTPAHERRRIMLKAASLMLERKDQFLEAFRETQVGEGFNAFNFHLAHEMLLEIASLATALPGTIPALPSNGDESTMTMVQYEPFGTVLAIAPWNAATILSARAICYPLIAGNCVVLKASEYSPRTHALWGPLFADAGLPAGVLNILNFSPSTTATLTPTLLSDSRIRMLNFTGSTRVGKLLATICAQRLKPSILELGGKAPAIVRADAELDKAARDVLWGGWVHQGQVCMSTERVIVEEGVMGEFVEALKVAAKGVKAGPMSDSTTNVKGLISVEAAERFEELVNDAVSKGAKVLIPETGFKRDRNIVTPVVLANTNETMPIHTQETFAPCLILLPSPSDASSISIANSTPYGLTASIFTRDTHAALRMSKKLECGAVHVNSPTIEDHPAVVHGGWKESGWGRFGGVEGVRGHLQLRSVSVREGGGNFSL
ncbi:hypothetical protein YB2330_001489 [Saitoella coloradoensis]